MTDNKKHITEIFNELAKKPAPKTKGKATAKGSAAAAALKPSSKFFSKNESSLMAGLEDFAAMSEEDAKNIPMNERINLYMRLYMKKGRGLDISNLLTKLHRSSGLDPKFEAWEFDKKQEFLNFIKNDKKLLGLRDNWKKLPKDDKLTALKYVANKQAEIYGFKLKAKVVLTNWKGIETIDESRKFKTIAVKRGCYTGKEVQINGHKDGCLNDFSAAIGVLCHEVQHAWQHDLGNRFKAKKIAPDAPYYHQAGIFSLSFMEDIYIKSEGNHQDYQNQPIEVHARIIQAHIIRALSPISLKLGLRARPHSDKKTLSAEIASLSDKELEDLPIAERTQMILDIAKAGGYNNLGAEITRLYNATNMAKEISPAIQQKFSQYINFLATDEMVANMRENWNDFSDEARAAELQRLMDKHAEIFGYTPPVVNVREDDTELSPKARISSDNLCLDITASAQSHDQYRLMAATISQMGGMVWHRHLRDGITKRTLKEDAPEYNIAGLIAANYALQIPPQTDKNLHQKQPIIALATEHSKSVGKAFGRADFGIVGPKQNPTTNPVAASKKASPKQ